MAAETHRRGLSAPHRAQESRRGPNALHRFTGAVIGELELLREDLKYGEGVGEKFIPGFRGLKNRVMGIPQQNESVWSGVDRKGRYFRRAASSGLLAVSLALAACTADGAIKVTQAVVTQRANATEGSVPPVEGDFTANDPRVESILIPGSEQNIANTEKGTPLSIVQVTLKDLPHVFFKGATEDENIVHRTTFSKILHGQDANIEKLKAAHPEIASVEAVLTITRDQDPQTQQIRTYLTPFLRATTTSGQVDLYYTFRVEAVTIDGKAAFLQASRNSTEDLAKILHRTVSTPAGDVEIWFDTKGTVVQYKNAQGEYWESSTSAVPTFLGYDHENPNILNELNEWLASFDENVAHASDLESSADQLRERNLQAVGFVTNARGDIFQYDVNRNINSEYNVDTLGWTYPDASSIRQKLQDLQYKYFDPNEAYTYGLDDEDLPVYWHAPLWGEQLDIAQNENGIVTIIETDAEAIQYQVNRIAADHGLPKADYTMSVDGIQIVDASGTIVLVKNAAGEYAPPVVEPTAEPTPVAPEFPLPLQETYSPTMYTLIVGGETIPPSDWGNQGDALKTLAIRVGGLPETVQTNSQLLVGVFLRYTPKMQAERYLGDGYIAENARAYVAVLPPGELPIVDGVVDCSRCIFIEVTDKASQGPSKFELISPVDGILNDLSGGGKGGFRGEGYDPDRPGGSGIGRIANILVPNKLVPFIIDIAANQAFMDFWKDPSRTGQTVWAEKITDAQAAFAMPQK